MLLTLEYRGQALLFFIFCFNAPVSPSRVSTQKIPELEFDPRHKLPDGYR